MGKPISITPLDLYARIGTAGAPRVVDVRRMASFEARDPLIIGVPRRERPRANEKFHTTRNWTPEVRV